MEWNHGGMLLWHWILNQGGIQMRSRGLDGAIQYECSLAGFNLMSPDVPS